jgi:small subunit ribosomal protein S14
MARRCKIEKNKRQQKLIIKYKPKRDEYRSQIRDPNLSFEEKLVVQQKMQSLPRDSNGIRLRNRCLITGRSRGVYRKFGLARTKLRELAMVGYIPGLRKASW